jgi:hypothetical protein
MTSYVQALLAVARHENESVDHYAKVCGCSSGAMSKRLSELGEVSSRDRKAGDLPQNFSQKELESARRRTDE